MPPTYTHEGAKAALALREAHPGLGILLLSQSLESRYVTDLARQHARGFGYLLKDRVTDVTVLLDALGSIAAGGTVLDPEVVAQLLGRRQVDERMQRLTARESTVLALLAEGKSNQAIARTLHLSEGSVEKHITAVFQKLDLEQDDSGNRRVLAALAHLEHGGGSPQTGA